VHARTVKAIDSKKRFLAACLAMSLLVLGQGAQAQAQPLHTQPAASRLLAPLTRSEAKALSADVTQRVIVVMKGQLPGTRPGPSTVGVREAAMRQVQRPVISELRATHAKDVRALGLINAVAAIVSPGERARLVANSAVAEVVPDQLITLTNPAALASQLEAAPGTGHGQQGTQPGQAVPPLPGACAPPGQVQLDPQALGTIHADSQDPSEPTARSLGITGAGVKAAFIADGLDINNPDFIRPDGQHVFVDYQDFSGEGTSVPTGGEEAFLDASSIAAQGNQVYDVSHYSALPLNRPCDIRIEGVAPGASLVGLDIFGAEDAGFVSSFLQAINYAVTVDHVNVLNESLGSNYYPDDSAALDLIKAANDAAVAAGTTVVVSSGDAGVTSTIGTPATDPNVISVGASTTYRIDAQDGYGGARFAGVRGWLNNNISSFSSSGFTQSGSTVSLVAPGELNWALCSTDTAMYAECVSLAGQPSPVQQTGGTSESAPLTAGVAALVIQAYAKTHRGIDPSPAVVKQILTSTADDIGAPADQQGSGLVDAYKAVLAAEAYQQPDEPQQTAAPFQGGGHGAVPSTLLTSSGQLNVVAAPGTTEQLSETLTNNGPTTQNVSLSTRALTDYQTIRTALVTLTDTASPHLFDWQGINNNYETVNFFVPPGVNRLNTAMAFQNASATDLDARVRLTLIDANGDLAGYSVPQGDGNYGDIQVTNPVPGRWTAYIYSRDSADGGTTGPVLFSASVAYYTTFGSVSPTSLTLGPGQSDPVALTVTTPGSPGDTSGALLLTAGTTRHAGLPFGAASSEADGPDNGNGQDATVPNVTTVPVTLRSLAPAGTTSFTGLLTGGNGRSAVTGQTNYYQFDLPAGLPEVNATVTLANNPNNQLYTWLIDPAGDAVAFASNLLITTNPDGSLAATNTLGANLHALAPAGGLWTLIVLFAPQVSGMAISEPFTVDLNEDAVPASAPGLPDSPDISLTGTANTFNVTVFNNGTAPEAYFVDARLSTSTEYSLASLTSPDTTVPLSIFENVPLYDVPTGTTSLLAEAQTTGTEPIQFDFAGPAGDPDTGSPVGLSVSATYSSDPVAQGGAWDIAPTTVGPFGATGATPEAVSTSLIATTPAFDPAVSSATGDMWETTVNPAVPVGFLIVPPGQSGTIPVTIAPSGPSGSIVSGTLYVDDASLVIFGSLIPNGNEVAAFPYSYKVG
jgi:hypothetical protein